MSSGRRLSFFALAGLATAGFASLGLSKCSSGTTPTGCPDPNVFEPDDSLGTAHAGTLGTILRACIYPATDVDTYSFQVPTDSTVGGVLNVRLVEASLDIVPGITFFAQSTSQIAQFPGTTPGENVGAFLAVAPGETIYVQVYATSGEGNYGLEVDYTPVNDPNEPDNTFAQAKSVGDGGVTTGLYLFHPQSSSTPLPDYLSFAVNDGGTAAVQVAGLPTSLNPEVHLYDPTQTELAALGPADAGPDGGAAWAGPIVDGGVVLSLSAAVPGPGTYYVKVSADDRPSDWVGPGAPPAHFTQPYSVTVTSP